MAKISRVRLELPLLGGNQYRAVVKYRVRFDPIEVSQGAQFRHVVRLFADDTNADDVFPFTDSQDDNIRTLVNQVITAQDSPLVVNLDQGPYSIEELNEDPEFIAGPFRDEIRARVSLTPVTGPWAPKTRVSGMVQQAFEPA